MTLQFPQSSKLVRFALTGLMATQTAIATTVVHEFVATTPSISSTQQATAQGNKNLTEIYKKASPAVVLIETPNGSGSEAIIAANGLIVTNAHVVEGFGRVRVTLLDGRRMIGEVVASGSSDCMDLALVRIPNQTKLPSIELAANNSTEIGMDVIAIGNPLGTSRTLTDGRISNLVPGLGRVLTDVRLSQGNSGGPLLNRRGQLVGVIEGGYGRNRGDGLNVAIASEQVQALMQASKQGLSPVLGRFLIPATSSNSVVTRLMLNGAKSNGMLQGNDNLMCKDKSRADLYTFEGEADQPVMISMSSSQIGSYLLLLGPNGQVIAKDQSEKQGGMATVLAKLPKTGMYTVIANALRPEQLGAYQLQATVPILFEEGRLTPNSPRLQDGSPYRSYSFTGKSNQTIALALRQFDFEPYLILLNAEGKVVAKGKVDRQSVISAKLPQDGSYTLIVSTVNPSDRGQFSLSVHTFEEKAQPNKVSQGR